MSKLVTVEYFADLRDKRGIRTEQVETSSDDAIGLFDELAAKHGFDVRRETIRVAVNDEITSWNHEISAGDTVVFLTPFGGG